MILVESGPTELLVLDEIHYMCVWYYACLHTEDY